MKTVIEQLSKQYKLYHVTPATEQQIKEAEEKLGLTFSEDYKTYLSIFGALSFGAHEFTGLNVESYINVVDITSKEKLIRESFPSQAYVIQSLGIEGMIIVQTEQGEILQLDENNRVSHISDSFEQYLTGFIQ